MRAALALLLALASAPVLDAQPLTVDVRSRALQPGEAIAVVITAPPATTALTLRAFDATWPTVRLDDGSWHGLVGIDLDRKPGPYVISASTSGDPVLSGTKSIVVMPKRFRRRVLSVAPDYVNPPKALVERIEREAAFTRDVYEHVGGEPSWRFGFRRPVDDPANSSFGTRSVFNGEARSPHAGTDFLSPAGTPIHAPAGGRIVAARELFFTGNTVIIDHGSGVFSMLAHMSRLDVHEGDVVQPGDVVGLVGATGRVTGPHLHWAMRVGPARVDPLSALAVLTPGK